MEVGICLLQVLQSVQERYVFGPPIGIEKIQLVRQPVVMGLRCDAEEASDSDSACEKHGRLCTILCRMKEPAAEPIFTSVASVTFFSERLKAVSRIRVVKTNSFSNGGRDDEPLPVRDRLSAWRNPHVVRLIVRPYGLELTLDIRDIFNQGQPAFPDLAFYPGLSSLPDPSLAGVRRPPGPGSGNMEWGAERNYG